MNWERLNGGNQRAEVPGGWIYLSQSGHDPVFVADPKRDPIRIAIVALATAVIHEPEAVPSVRLAAQAILEALK